MLQLQLFSLQILHRENTFCAKGLTVDATLLTAVSNYSNCSNYIDQNIVRIRFYVSMKYNIILCDSINTFILQIVGSITTYLLILIQFMFTSNSCNENPGNATQTT